VRAGDILLAIDGHEVRSAQDALAQLANHKPGVSVQLRLQRGLKVLELQCQVVERPSQI
jgi:serine protease DegQ